MDSPLFFNQLHKPSGQNADRIWKKQNHSLYFLLLFLSRLFKVKHQEI